MISATSKLQVVHTELRDKILRGEFQCGDRLPTTEELAKQFDCSVGMASKAIAMLVHSGLVEQRRGLGTRVLKNVEEESGSTLDLNAFAFIYPSEKHEGIWRTVKGFQDAAQEQGRRTITLTTGTDYKKEGELIGRLKEFDVKGAVVYSTMQGPDDQVYVSQMLSRSTIPLVLACINLPGMNLPAAFFDDFHGGYTMTKYLLGRGCKRVGLFASSRAPDACQGYRWAMQEAGVEIRPELMLMEQSMHANFQEPVREPAERAEAYLKARPDLDGVVCGCDFLALGLIEAAQRLGRRVPQDLKVIGADDFSLSASAPVPLTTYHVPYEEIGHAAFQLLCERVKNGTVPLLEHRITGEIVVRKSA